VLSAATGNLANDALMLSNPKAAKGSVNTNDMIKTEKFKNDFIGFLLQNSCKKGQKTVSNEDQH
jgi:hypothetical protein